MQKFDLKHGFCVAASSEIANIDDVIMTFLYHVNNYATYLLENSHALSTISELFKSGNFF